jgi:hypothetical protein
MALSTIPFSGLGADASKQGVNFRNFIINGDMSIAQRGTSATGKTTLGYYTIDRFRQVISNMGTWTFSQSTDVPSGQGFAYSQKWDCTTADASPASAAQTLVQYRFEGQMLQSMKKGTSNAESVTLSFWVKTNKTGTYIIELFDRDNNRTISKSYTVNSSSTWEKKTITIEGDTTGTLDNDNDASLDLHFWVGSGSQYNSGTLQTTWGTRSDADRAVGQVNLADNTANEWYITGVQLEVGTSASDFEFLPYDVNLRRCMRYYQTYQSGGMICWSGTTISGANYFQDVRHVVPMRTSATIGNLTVENRNGFNTSNPSIDYGNTQGFRATLQSNANTNEAYFRFKYTADAEL